jgi:L-ribulose-5-phosphate 3-epimerase
MDRRTFAVSATAVAATTMLGPKQVVAGQFTGKIKKAIKFHMATEKISVEDKFRMIQDLGFDGVETRTALGNANRELVRSYAQASEKTGLPIHGCVHSNNPSLIDAIDQAKSLGATSVLHVVAYTPAGSYLENYKATQDIIRRAVDHAEKQQIMILCENVWASYLIEPMGMARFIDEIDSPMVGIYFDVGNVVRWGWPHHWLEVIGHRAKKLDIKEYDLDVAMTDGMKKGFGMPLGEGSIDWQKVREQLVKLDYSGWATAEVPGGDRNRLADIASQMDRVLDL